MTYDTKASIPRLLARLNATIISNDGTTAIIQVMPDMPHATVSIPSLAIREWCITRLATRQAHKGYGFGCGIMKQRS